MALGEHEFSISTATLAWKVVDRVSQREQHEILLHPDLVVLGVPEVPEVIEQRHEGNMPKLNQSVPDLHGIRHTGTRVAAVGTRDVDDQQSLTLEGVGLLRDVLRNAALRQQPQTHSRRVPRIRYFRSPGISAPS